MNLNSRRATAILFFVAVALCSGAALPAQSAPQTKASRSDEDLNAIGHRTVGQGVNLYSLEKEKKLGEQLAKEVERSSRMLDDPAVTDYVNRLAQKIAQNSDARGPIIVRVIDSDVINAFTLPGGFLYVNTGLLLHAEGEAELAGVLARGIAHTALRSSTNEATKGELMQLATVPLILLGPGGWAGYGNYEGMNLSIPVTYLKYRRDAERAADFFGLQYLYKTGYDPESYIRFLERTWPQTPAGKDSLPKVFHPFPPVPERVENMKKEIAKILPPRDGAIVSSAEFQEVKEHLRSRKLNESSTPNSNLGKPTLRKRTDPTAPDRGPLTPDCD
jgi:predicted Zn-dependent protease